MIEIAAVVGCSVDTLERRFADIIKDGQATGRSSLRRYQWEAAKKGNTAMLIWLGKQMLDQTDRLDQRTELTAPGVIKIGYADEGDVAADTPAANAASKTDPAK